MFFASDNGGPAHPKVMQAVVDGNQGFAMPYGNDPSMDAVRDEVRRQFEAPEAEVYLVATGTAANALALASVIRPFQTIYCTPMAHIEMDECGAPEFYSGGAKLTLVPGGDKMAPDALRASIEGTNQGFVHGVQRGALSLTQATERGGVYTVAEIEALAQVAREFDLPVHLDGARIANALAAGNSSPADMTWRAGVDVLSLGGTKNGCLGVEAVVWFDPAPAWEFELRRKRGGHLFSKHRFLAAQMKGYLQDDLWLDMASEANARATHLAEGLVARGGSLEHPVEANMVFAALPRRVHRHLLAQGASYYVDRNKVADGDPEETLVARMVCDWSIEMDAIDRFLACISEA